MNLILFIWKSLGFSLELGYFLTYSIVSVCLIILHILSVHISESKSVIM